MDTAELAHRVFWPALLMLPATAAAVGSIWLFSPLIAGLLATIALAGAALGLRGPQMLLSGLADEAVARSWDKLWTIKLLDRRNCCCCATTLWGAQLVR